MASSLGGPGEVTRGVQVQGLSWGVGVPSVHPSILRVGTGLRWALLSVWAWNQVGWEAREGCAQCCRGEWCKGCGPKRRFPAVGSMAGWHQAQGDLDAELASSHWPRSFPILF